MSRTLSKTLVVAIVITASACLSDAERGNPLDPLSDSFVDEGTVSGRIVDRSLRGVAGGTVRLEPGGQTTSTDGSGDYELRGVSSGEYTVLVEAEGYSASSETVSVAPGVPATADFELNGLPVFDDWTINTAHISRWWPLEDLFQIEITASASDGDGIFDLDKVWIEIPDYAFSDTLLTTPEAGTFAKTLPELNLPTTTIHSLLGRPMHLSVRDRLDVTTSTPVVQLVRVIDETPVAVEEAFQTGPQDCLVEQAGGGAVPLIEWNPLFLPYAFVHRVEVIRVDAGLETLVETLDDIPSTSTTATATPLPPGEYYWTVAVVDEFQNRSRSKQVGFCVVP
ncbi:MAG: carboxypeptidase-like regulatory domain-containing protein [Rhodothermales bacterium]|nr:carboxypeptidase-like regulatory domain-containing protein [Rhodothermales bacterium]